MITADKNPRARCSGTLENRHRHQDKKGDALKKADNEARTIKVNGSLRVAAMAYMQAKKTGKRNIERTCKRRIEELQAQLRKLKGV